MGTGDPSAPSEPDRAAATAATPARDFANLATLNAAIAAAEPGVTGSRRAVPGEGPPGAAIAFVGEQPGDQEDLAGRPFVGPAGRLLDRALRDAGIARGKVYVTNAVKHFKFEPRGKRRIHRKPTAGEVAHYRWWLEKELDLVHPAIVVALGATAALALAGRAVPVTRARGPATFDGRAGYITVHPSYLLRIPDPMARDEAYGAFVADLKQIRSLSRQLSVKTAT
ncbi:uracil-DNA glycosylase family domain-containing protein [Pseudoxanthobacter soli DSM 19599]|uniref:Type-4 uracil-DNA glycosylase n=1 Tax=Pseudoxanthobacter soli DSM 19599 TaxID=1123029 RepID=A0A1M7ZPM3_9HYPH|nr:uracil-DNA glycosylase family domain-containing protein [Pseudoxanthobacter soli DSM 19599]